jgi:hypothetical protein
MGTLDPVIDEGSRPPSLQQQSMTTFGALTEAIEVLAEKLKSLHTIDPSAAGYLASSFAAVCKTASAAALAAGSLSAAHDGVVAEMRG